MNRGASAGGAGRVGRPLSPCRFPAWEMEHGEAGERSENGHHKRCAASP